MEEIGRGLLAKAGDGSPAGIVTRAVSAIDVALWDIRGKALDMPVWRLLGAGSGAVPTYASGHLWRRDGLDTLAEAAAELAGQGFRAMKLRLGGETSAKAEVARLCAVREVVGGAPTLVATPSPVPPATIAPPLSPTPTAAAVAPVPASGATPEATAADSSTWRGLVVAVEHRCSPYDSDDYSYSQSVESRIVASMGNIIYGPYTGTWFDSTSQTDIEHIVARSEAHDSGFCTVDAATKRRFASDLLNLTLASPAVNRSQKSGKDAAEWLPDLNHCWFANRVVEVRQRYGLTVDQRERDLLEGTLSACTSTEMVVWQGRPAQTATPLPATGGGQTGDALQLYDDNGNGRITCAEARSHDITPVRRGHPAYPYMNDADNDGVVCE